MSSGSKQISQGQDLANTTTESGPAPAPQLASNGSSRTTLEASSSSARRVAVEPQQHSAVSRTDVLNIVPRIIISPPTPTLVVPSGRANVVEGSSTGTRPLETSVSFAAVAITGGDVVDWDRDVEGEGEEEEEEEDWLLRSLLESDDEGEDVNEEEEGKWKGKGKGKETAEAKVKDAKNNDESDQAEKRDTGTKEKGKGKADESGEGRFTKEEKGKGKAVNTTEKKEVGEKKLATSQKESSGVLNQDKRRKKRRHSDEQKTCNKRARGANTVASSSTSVDPSLITESSTSARGSGYTSALQATQSDYSGRHDVAQPSGGNAEAWWVATLADGANGDSWRYIAEDGEWYSYRADTEGRERPHEEEEEEEEEGEDEEEEDGLDVYANEDNWYVPDETLEVLQNEGWDWNGEDDYDEETHDPDLHRDDGEFDGYY